MPWKKKLSHSSRNLDRKVLHEAKLYLILDTEVPCPPIFKQPGRRENYDSLFEIAKQAVSGGVDVLQLRDKKGSAKDILEFSRKLLDFLNKKSLMIPFIMNDRVDLALACRSAGVHLGQDDMPVSVARKLMGSEAIIGTSCQNLQQARHAEEEGADYIGFGSVFKTKTKPDRSPMDLKLLEEVLREIEIPVFAIGGIDQQNIGTLRQIGVRRIAVCRAICEAGDVWKATRGFVGELESIKVSSKE